MELAERKCYSPKAGGSTRTTGQMLVTTGIVSLAARTQPKPPPDVRVRAAAAFINMFETSSHRHERHRARAYLPVATGQA